jgi:hypothetical protein
MLLTSPHEGRTPRMKRIFLFIGAVSVAAILTTPARAQDVVTVDKCPGLNPLPVTFEVDCSHVADGATKGLCQAFAQNQACKVFPAYRKITGILMEESCPVFKYTIYDKDKWPYQDSKDGGRADRCGAEILTDFSLLNSSQIGPIDVHEILHVYQSALGAIPYQHILFGPSMTEARGLIGDNKGYVTALTRMKEESNRAGADLEAGKFKGDGECLQAELYEESILYINDHRNLEMFYLKLQRSSLKDMADRQARFNRMYNVVSNDKARPFLLAHGCGAF